MDINKESENLKISDYVADGVNKALEILGIGGAKASSSDQPTTSAEQVIKPLPLQPNPTNLQQDQQPVTPPSNYDPSALQKLQQTDTTQKLSDDDKEAMTKSLAEQTKIYNDQTKYIENLSNATNTANQFADSTLGSVSQKTQEYETKIKEANASLKKDFAELDSRIEEIRSTEFKDFWADKSTASKIGMALAVGFGQYAATMTGGQNMAWNILQKAMDDDFRLQQANHDRQIKNIQMLKLGMDQKEKLISAADKEFEAYKVARGSYVTDLIDKKMQQTGKGLTPALQDLMNKTKLAQQAAYQSTMMNMVDKKTESVVSGFNKPPITHEQAMQDSSNEKTQIGAYKKAVEEYNKVKNLKDSGNPGGASIYLIASQSGLGQGSYPEDKFDATQRSVLQKAKDYGYQQLSEADKKIANQAAMKFFKLNVKSTYDAVKDFLPTYWNTSMITSKQMGQKPTRNMYVPDVPVDILNESIDLSKTGMKAK